jgi:hypothetical protein
VRADDVGPGDFSSHDIPDSLFLPELAINGRIDSDHDDSGQVTLADLAATGYNLLLDQGCLFGAVDVQAAVRVADIAGDGRDEIGGPVAEGLDVAQEAL